MVELNTVKNRLEAMVAEFFSAMPDHFLVDVKLLPGKVQVFVDSDTGIRIDTCGELSRWVEKYLDEEKPLGEKYILEVSSPGMDNPLKLLRQYKRYLGREVAVLRTDGIKIEGTLKEASELIVSVETTKTEKVDKKKVTTNSTIEIPFTEIKSTKLKLNF
jgi:ribosome maturation factor RimP